MRTLFLNRNDRLDLHVRLRGLQFGAHAEPDAQSSSGVVRPGRSVSERSCKASLGRSVARKITPQMLENSRITQTNQEIAGSARFFRSLLDSTGLLPGLTKILRPFIFLLSQFRSSVPALLSRNFRRA
jgi:hypothetical protein